MLPLLDLGKKEASLLITTKTPFWWPDRLVHLHMNDDTVVRWIIKILALASPSKV